MYKRIARANLDPERTLPNSHKKNRTKEINLKQSDIAQIIIRF